MMIGYIYRIIIRNYLIRSSHLETQMHSNSSKGAIGPPNDVSNNDQEYLKGKIKQYL